MPFDPHRNTAERSLDHANRHAVITPNDSTDVADIPKFYVVGATAGPVACHDEAGVLATHYVAAGGRLPIRARRILATGTTASPIIACY